MTHRAGPDLDGLDDWTGPPMVRRRGAAVRFEIRQRFSFRVEQDRRPALCVIPVVFDSSIPPGILVIQEGGCYDVPIPRTVEA